MPQHIARPTVIEAAGNVPKRIEEFVGRVNTGTASVSVARMKSPSGWVEPAQTLEFDEISLVLAGMMRVESAKGVLEVNAGEAVLVRVGEKVRYSTPGPEGAEYVAICVPAFSPETAHREENG